MTTIFSSAVAQRLSLGITRFAGQPRPSKSEPERLLVFTRWPVPGAAKTRLIPALGPLRAADLQRRMTEHAAAAAQRWAAACGSLARRRVEVWRDGGTQMQMRRWLGAGFDYRRQRPGHLGQRMAHALADTFGRGARRALLIGADCPGIDPPLLEQASAALDDHDLTLGPTADGGYWLVGMTRPLPVFEDIPWSTGEVLSRTLDKAKRLGLRVRLLPTLNDIDLPDDLPHARRFFDPAAPIISVIVPALNEAGNIQAALRSAAGDGIETLVADGGSHDGTPALAAALGARVLRTPRGRARQQNAGAGATRANTLLFLHADTQLPHGWPTGVFEALLDAGAVGGSFLWRTDMDGFYMRAAQLMVRARTVYGREPWGDQALFVRRGDFEAVGGFPRVPIAEDRQFVIRLRRRGRLVSLAKEVITSGRRWQRHGIVRSFATNRLIVLGSLIGLPPSLLARLYTARI